MRIDYYGEFSVQAERIEGMLTADKARRSLLKEEGTRWRRNMADKLCDDLIPPMDRRDIMSIIQNLCYVFYEVWRLPELKLFSSAEGMIMKLELQKNLQILREEIKGLKSKTTSVERLRKRAYRLLAAWHSSYTSGCDHQLCDGYEAVGDAILRLADSLETALAIN